MTRRDRRKINWGSQPRRELPTSAGPPPEPPEFLGTWRWRQPDPLETTGAWLERTARQRAEIVAAASDWLRVGQAVKIHLDPQVGGGDVAGRVGTIFRVCSLTFDDYVYVHFTAAGREKMARIRMLPLEIVFPTE